jgi:hypothetical protein
MSRHVEWFYFLFDHLKQVNTSDIFSSFFFLQEIAYTMDEVGKRVTAGERRWEVIEDGTFARKHWVRE